jgi:hypothetical protein
LLCSPQFRRERDEILGDDLRVVSLVPDEFIDAAGAALPVQVQDFLVRWRLLGMAGSRLPVPMRPMLGGQFPMSIIGQLMAVGGLFNLPDTFPIPSRDELREILNDAVRSDRPDHLGEWMQITGKQNPAKNKIDRFARLFELQHYWEALLERHRPALKRQTAKLQGAVATFLQTSEDSVRYDIRFLQTRLGSNWGT